MMTVKRARLTDLTELWAVSYRDRKQARKVRLFVTEDNALIFYAECVDADPVLYRSTVGFTEIKPEEGP